MHRRSQQTFRSRHGEVTFSFCFITEAIWTESCCLLE